MRDSSSGVEGWNGKRRCKYDQSRAPRTDGRRKTPSSSRHFFSLAALAVLSMSTFAHSSSHPRPSTCVCACVLPSFCCNLSLEWRSPPFLLSSTSRIKDLPPSLRVFGFISIYRSPGCGAGTEIWGQGFSFVFTSFALPSPKGGVLGRVSSG